MEETEKDGAAVRIPPPSIFLGFVIAGVLLHRYAAPLSLDMSRALRIGLALIPAVPGLVLMGGAIRLFRRTGQDPKPWAPTPEIISTGVYGITRNPMYLGMTLVQAAIGLGLGNGWILLFVPASMAVVQATAIRHEEVYLVRKFGEPYTRYKSSVRRWI
jgi:protein-S-isoprenylcysteine O-methyltransferase Ste14